THFASFKGGTGVLALALRLGDFVPRRVLLAFESFVLADQPAAQCFKRGNVGEGLVSIETSIPKPGADVVDVVSNERGVQHGTSTIDSICDLDMPLVRCGL